jgi:S-formylglutathione hydrolase FrmB
MKQQQPPRANQVSTEVVHLLSRLNGTELPYLAILPAGYRDSKDSFGVLYLLHGLFGRFDNWTTNTDLLRYAGKFPFIIICAEAGDSWYVDNPEIENHFYESYLTEELIPDVEQRFKVRSERDSRAVAGLSMGGYGAFKLAFRQPHLFCLAAAMSGAFHAAEISRCGGSGSGQGFEEWKELQPSILKAFGRGNRKICERNDLFRLANNFPADEIGTLPFFYFDCGTSDSFLPVNLKLAEAFRKRGIGHRFRQFTGGHDWNYWNLQVRGILRVAKMHLGA